MAKIEVSTKIKSTADKVWDIISDIDNETKYWKGTKEIHNISKDGNKIKREVIIAFRDSKCLQEVTMYPKEKIEVEFTKGIIQGTKTINLKTLEGEILLEAIWDVKLSGMMGMFTGMIKKHVKSGTEQALQAIKSEAER
ncbi:MAG: SRPBCC family protein [Nitrososphaerota archaeon]|nr:SRPBCC family protein [Nitrososphaerota archaeon]MDG7054298.1 SRPBCC family protein [Nitrososphaerota archaeon]